METPQDMTTGTIHKTNKSGDLKIVDYAGCYDVTVEFLDTGYVTKSQSSLVRRGKVKDPFFLSAYGVGFIGVGRFDHKSEAYKTWKSMLCRCYGGTRLNTTSYAGCSVDSSWHCFQNFAKWHQENYPKDGMSYQLDKDLLEVGNKIYSHDTCVFVPAWLNSFTLNSKASRGRHPLGVSFNKSSGKFCATCQTDGTATALGHFSTPEEAHLAWREHKLSLALDKKHAMDKIDKRIYPNVVQIIMSAT